MISPLYTRRFDERGLDEVALVGGKTASLGEMFRVLVPLCVPMPDGTRVHVAEVERRMALELAPRPQQEHTR